MKKLLSILLCLALLCSMMAVTVLAFDAGENYPDDPPNDWFDNIVIPPDNSITLEIPIVKIVRQLGDEAPGRQVFTFAPTDFKYDETYGPENNDKVNYTVSGGTIVTNGPGEYYGTLKIKVADEEEFAKLDDGFSIVEVKDGAAGWIYDTSVWGVKPYIDEFNQNHVWEPDDTNVTHNEVGNGLVFVNTYVGTSGKPQLNKVDHFAFMQGYPGGAFGPDRNMTRAEVATMFARLMVEQMEVGKTYPCSFSDVPASQWYANYIGYLEKFEILTGYPDGTFRPDAPITRAEFATIACRFEELTAGKATFSDVPDSYWGAKYINFAAARGWVTGYPDGTFGPQKNITRAEVVTITCRLLERKADREFVKAHLNEMPRTFTDLPTEKSHWAYWSIVEAANGHDYTKSGADETWIRVYK